jgi:4'-phosphopantetheinyl transferase
LPNEEIVLDVWHVRPPELSDGNLAACDAVLSEEERAAVVRFVQPANRLERLVARAMVRTVLSQYRDAAPTSWRFRAGEHGKPAIDPPSVLRFNLAHHPTMVVCTVTESREVGIDVEPLSRHAQILGVSRSVFAPSELVDLAALSENARADRAVSLWTLKEAYIKARGMGLALPLQSLAFHFDAPRPRLVAPAAVDPDPGRWWFDTIDVDGHRIAVAVEAPDVTWRIQLRPYVLHLPS